VDNDVVAVEGRRWERMPMRRSGGKDLTDWRYTSLQQQQMYRYLKKGENKIMNNLKGADISIKEGRIYMNCDYFFKNYNGAGTLKG
jgi:hypothetical protein